MTTNNAPTFSVEMDENGDVHLHSSHGTLYAFHLMVIAAAQLTLEVDEEDLPALQRAFLTDWYGQRDFLLENNLPTEIRLGGDND